MRARQAAATARALAHARRALIGWSVGVGLAGSGEEHAPGLLPFPDRNTDRNGYDGEADCVTSWLSDRHLIGRFAWAGENSPCPARTLGCRAPRRVGRASLVCGVAQPRQPPRRERARSLDQPRPPRRDARLSVAPADRRERQRPDCKRRRAPRDRRRDHCAGTTASGSDTDRAGARPAHYLDTATRERGDLRQRRLRRLPGRGHRSARVHGLPGQHRRGVHPVSGLPRNRGRHGLVQRPHRLCHGARAAARGRGACSRCDGGGSGAVSIELRRVPVDGAVHRGSGRGSHEHAAVPRTRGRRREHPARAGCRFTR